MPNHVEQDLVITGNSSVLKEFMEFAQEDESLLSANKFIPYPEKFRILDAAAKIEHQKGNYSVHDGFNSGGYEWCLKNWGTKWGVYSVALSTQKLTGKVGKLKYFCKSAWSPATQIVLAMSQKFPDLTFDMKYYERGMGYKGQFTVQNGNITKDVQDKYAGKRGG